MVEIQGNTIAVTFVGVIDSGCPGGGAHLDTVFINHETFQTFAVRKYFYNVVTECSLYQQSLAFQASLRRT